MNNILNLIQEYKKEIDNDGQMKLFFFRAPGWFLVLLLTAGLVLAQTSLITAQDEQPADDQQTEEEEAEKDQAEEEMETATIKEEVTVTGTRVEGRTVTTTPAPVDIIDSSALQSTGSSETGKILQLLAPSFNFSTTFVSDGTDIIRPATLRGLGADQVLVLINGKRRHQQSLLNVQQTCLKLNLDD